MPEARPRSQSRWCAAMPSSTDGTKRKPPASSPPVPSPSWSSSTAPAAEDRAQGIEDLRLLFSRVPVYDRAWQIREVLTRRGQHRSAGAAYLVVAAAAELQELTLLHRDRDFECIAAVTGQALQYYGQETGK